MLSLAVHACQSAPALGKEFQDATAWRHGNSDSRPSISKALAGAVAKDGQKEAEGL